ncbi:Glycosyltransferase like family 2 [Fodinibius roseus]|uniref:Glycosyltransferase like family 2 n=1 Tax=Fodinibius roseus TaxID=1194090 RepID=A0A1M5F7P0_9BACT|nr:glycosyltransferase [Fodinibius roseus]SHF87081.1 Glycosyltransferase like family 2 [Fodinibius roseus]
MIFIEVIQYGIGILMMILLGYQLTLSIQALKVRNKIAFNSVQNRQFAIIMPAPKNEQMISKSLYSLFGLVYPKNLYDVFLIGDNLSKDAINIAREMGANVLSNNGSSRQSDSRNLQGAFEKILQVDKTYDAILVIESYSLVSGNYLDVMNFYLDKGSDVIQSSNLMLPQSGLEAKRVKQINFLLHNLLKPLGRKLFGFCREYRGNGICFKTETLRSNPWLLDSAADDIGYGLKLQLKGIEIDFVQEAVLLTEIPTMPAKNKFKRKENCKTGWISTIRHYIPKLLKAGYRHKSWSYVKSVMDLITPSSVDMLLFAGIMGVINVFMWAVVGWSLSLVWIWIFVLLTALIQMVVGLYVINTYYQYYKSML